MSNPVDWTYSEGCGCKVTFFAESVYRTSRMTPGETCTVHTQAPQVVARDQFVKTAKAELRKYLFTQGQVQNVPPIGGGAMCGMSDHQGYEQHIPAGQYFKDDLDGGRLAAVDQCSATHPHEPAVAPVYDSEGRCLICCVIVRDNRIAALEREFDPPVCRLQFPDGTVPGNAREAAEGWKRWADEFQRQAVNLEKLTGQLTAEEAQAAYDAAEPIPISRERIEAIMEYACRDTRRITSLEAMLLAEREEWNAFCGITHPPGSPPLSPKDARLMRAIMKPAEEAAKP